MTRSIAEIMSDIRTNTTSIRTADTALAEERARQQLSTLRQNRNKLVAELGRQIPKNTAIVLTRSKRAVIVERGLRVMNIIEVDG